jgi:isopentenyl-diphosphate delta-isomerase
MAEHVILVRPDDAPVGTAEKLHVHRTGALHRAFSVFVFRPDGAMLLQRRAADKYHSPGLWSNTCCSHPRPGEDTSAAAQRRLQEEMGFECDLASPFSFLYRADVGDGLIEHEYDHVFLGEWDGAPRPDPAEVSDWRWIRPDALLRELRTGPNRFTTWFHVAFGELQARALV